MKNTKKDFLQIGTWVLFAFWIIAQIIVILAFWDKPQGSDQGAYMQLAKDCYEAGEWYPMGEHVYASYIWAPGFINFLILQLKLFGTLNLNMVFNLLMNIGIVGQIYYLGKYFFNKRTAYISIIFWVLLYSNLMIVAPCGTEIPFLFLALSGFCLCLNQRIFTIFLAGILFGLANWIRPLSIIFLIPILIFMFWQRYRWKYFLALFSSLFLIIGAIGIISQERTGYFIFQSSTSGVNLIMTANDRAYGGVASSVFADSTNQAYIANIESYTFAQRDSIWKSRSIEWIKDNPLKYTFLYVKKLGGLYIEDSWADRPILGGDGFVDSFVVGGKVSKIDFVKRTGLMALKSLFYYIIMGFFIYSLIVHYKEKISIKVILLLILLLGTASSCLFAISPRYHYPFLFVITLWAAYGVDYYLKAKIPCYTK